jgi:hypothetical protein
VNFGALGGNLELIHHAVRDLHQIQLLLLQNHLPGFRLRQEQQGAHNLRKPLDIGKRIDNGVAILFDCLAVNKGHFQLAPHHGDGGAQFVRNVGRELAHLVEVDLDALDHLIERLDQPVDFVSGPAHGYSQAQVGTADALRRPGHFENRRQRAARENPPHDASGRNDQQHQQHAPPGELVQNPARAREGCADGHIKPLVLGRIFLAIHVAGANQVAHAVGIGLVVIDRAIGLQHRANLVGVVESQFFVIGRRIHDLARGFAANKIDLLHAGDRAALIRVFRIHLPAGVVIQLARIVDDPQIGFDDSPVLLQFVMCLTIQTACERLPEEKKYTHQKQRNAPFSGASII